MDRIRIMASHWHFAGLVALFFLGVALAATAPLWTLCFVVFGIAVQYLNEYGLHRFIFHLPPPHSQKYFDILYQAHYGHHDFPTNRALFFAPWWVIVPVLLIDLSIGYVLASFISTQWALQITTNAVLIGGIGTFLCYEWFHMTAHLTVSKTAVERHVTKLHNQHHFRNFNKWFHVSPGGQVIDKAMGTAIETDALKTAQRVEFMRTLGMDPADERLKSARRRFATRYGLNDEEILRAER